MLPLFCSAFLHEACDFAVVSIQTEILTEKSSQTEQKMFKNNTEYCEA